MQQIVANQSDCYYYHAVGAYPASNKAPAQKIIYSLHGIDQEFYDIYHIVIIHLFKITFVFGIQVHLRAH